jgi:hypothetical protein
MTPVAHLAALARKNIPVAPICEVGWFCPGTRAGDGLPYRGQTRMGAMTPLAAWDRFELDHPHGDYVLLYAALARDVVPGTLDRLMCREIELARAHNHWLAQ